MTRDEHRAKCIEAMARTLCDRNEPGPEWQDYVPDATAALDALRGLARIVPIEATEEMIDAAYLRGIHDHFAEEREAWRAMSAAGDLTNTPERKP
jgi:hypothetical protein